MAIRLHQTRLRPHPAHQSQGLLGKTVAFAGQAISSFSVSGRPYRYLDRSQRRRIKEKRSLLRTLALTVRLNNKVSLGHANRVASNACVLGRQLGLNRQELETLYWGALLHDLGKLFISEAILLKPGPLTPAEYEEVKRHAGMGADVIEAAHEAFTEIAQVVRCHHERWDGRGYPLGLKGEAIPLMSRIVAIIDVFEALTSVRPYRQPLPPEQAFAYLREQAGQHFDPQLLPHFERLLQRGELQLAPLAQVIPDIAPQLRGGQFW